MSRIVVKFGGSNLKRIEDFQKVIEVIKRYNSHLVIVISALYGVTDILVDLLKRVRNETGIIRNKINSISEFHHKILTRYIDCPQYRNKCSEKIETEIDKLEKHLLDIHHLEEIPEATEDSILIYGERLSSLLLEMILKYINIECEIVLPEQMSLITNGEHGNATVNFSASENLVREKLSGGKIYIVPGYYGISPDNKITTFGRGGSDYTAAAIGRCINADYVDIWKDVPGFMSADPNLIKNAKVITNLTYREAAELSYFGARILHPRTVEPLQDENIPIRIYNINYFPDKFSSVTSVCNVRSVNPGKVKSVSCINDIALLRLKGAGVGIKPGILSQVMTNLGKAKINIKSVMTSQTCINVLLSQDDLDNGYKIINDLRLSFVKELEPLDKISLIAIVGEGISKIPEITSRVISAISRCRTNVQIILLGASEVAGYFIVDRCGMEETIKAIHQEFFD